MNRFLILVSILFCSSHQGCSEKGEDPAIPSDEIRSGHSVQDQLEKIAFSNEPGVLPDGWSIYRSSSSGFEVTVPKSERFDGSFFTSSDPLVVCGAEPRNKSLTVDEVLKANHKVLTMTAKPLFSKNIESELGKTEILGTDQGDGVYQIAKIVVTDEYLFMVAVTYEKPQQLSDPRHAAFFQSFKLVE